MFCYPGLLGSQHCERCERAHGGASEDSTAGEQPAGRGRRCTCGSLRRCPTCNPAGSGMTSGSLRHLHHLQTKLPRTWCLPTAIYPLLHQSVCHLIRILFCGCRLARASGVVGLYLSNFRHGMHVPLSSSSTSGGGFSTSCLPATLMLSHQSWMLAGCAPLLLGSGTISHSGPRITFDVARFPHWKHQLSGV